MKRFYILILLFVSILIYVEGCEQSIDEILKSIFMCTFDSDYCNNPSGGNSDINDHDNDGIVYETDCYGTYVKVWTQGNVVAPSLLWASLSRRGVPISNSQSITFSTGEFQGVYLKIPLNGLQLDSDEYSIDLYGNYANMLSSVGDPSSYTDRVINSKRIIIPQEVRQTAFNKQQNNSLSLSDNEICMVSNTSKSFTAIINSANKLQIVDGANYNSNIVWSMGGSKSSSGYVTSNGYFTANSDVYGLWECYLKAIDTSSTSPFNSDSISLIINPPTNSLYSCAINPIPLNRLVQISYFPLLDIKGISAELNTQYGKLCTSTDTTFEARSLAWVGMQIDTSIWSYKDSAITDHSWAHFGYLRIRFKGRYGYFDTYVTESVCHFWKYKIFVYDQPLSFGSQHEFKVELNSINGTWEFYLDSVLINIISDTLNFLQTATFSRSIYGGENINLEDDMPGKIGSTNKFSNCKIKPISSNTYISVNFNDSITYWEPVPLEWKIQKMNSTTIESWDADPQL